MKKITAMILLLLICGWANAQFGGGAGKFRDPLRISTDTHREMRAVNINNTTGNEGVSLLQPTDPDPVEVTATSGTPGPTTYATVKAAFDKINDGTHKGDITIKINGNSTEPASAVLNASLTGSADYSSVTVYPTTTGLTISGNLSQPLISLDGADNVTIDGRVNQAGGKDLVITNTYATSAATTATIQFFNDAKNNTVAYCTIKGSCTYSSVASGVIWFYTAAASGTGNTGNLIDHCDVTKDAAGTPLCLINSAGTSGSENTASITNCNLYDFSSNAIYIWNSKNWTISGNSLYQTGTITSAGAVELIRAHGDGYTISSNYLGGSSANCSGTWTVNCAGDYAFTGITVYGTTLPASKIYSNTIRNISITTVSNNNPFIGIYCGNGAMDIGTDGGNTIGSQTGTGSITVNSNTAGNLPFSAGIWIPGFATGPKNISNNTIGSIDVGNNQTADNSGHRFNAIVGGAGQLTISNNVIGSTTTANSINATCNQSASYSPGVGQEVFGIYCFTGASVTISGNTVAHINNASLVPSATNGLVKGIYSSSADGEAVVITGNSVYSLTSAQPMTGTGSGSNIIGIDVGDQNASSITVSGNTIHDLANTEASFGGSLIGLNYSGTLTGTNSVERNFIHTLSVPGAGSVSASIYGIRISAGVTTYSNNIINLGGNTKTTVYGIYETGGASDNNTLFFNTVYIGGTLASGSSNKSYGLYSESNQSTRDIRSNIFSNARSTLLGLNLHYAIYFQATGGTLTCDYNDYYVAGFGGKMGYYGGNKTILPIVTGQDVNSYADDPYFTNAGGTLATDYVPGAVWLYGATGTGILRDYLNNFRNAYPTMGALEYVVSNQWTGSLSSDWNNLLNWSLFAVPVGSDDVLIPGDAPIDPVVNLSEGSPALCNNLILDPGAVLTIAPGKALTVNNALTNNAGTAGLVIRSDVTGTGSLKHNTDNINATIQRYITGSSDLNAMMYHFVSVPLTPSTNSTSNLFLASYLFNFSESVNEWVSMGSSTTNPLDETRGYMIYYPEASHTYTFEGPMNNGSFTALTTFTPGNGFNLVPNPYPSAIDWNAASGWTKTNIAGTTYIWPAGQPSNSTNYASWNGVTGTNGGTRYVPVGQSFIVQSTAASPVLAMNNSTRVHNALAFWKTDEQIPSLLRIKAVAQSNNAFDELVIHFREDATTGFDSDFDANKLQGGADAPQFSSVVTGYGKLSINSLPFSTGEVIVPLSFSFSSASDVTFSASGEESFNDDVPVYLEDRIAGMTVNLRQNPVYTFAYQPENPPDRFMLHFSGPIGTEEQEINAGRAFVSNGHLFLDIPGMEGKEADIRIYNSLGQLLRTDHRVMNHVVTVEVPSVAGILLVHVVSADQQFVTKVLNK